jgi:hypothetical protein
MEMPDVLLQDYHVDVGGMRTSREIGIVMVRVVVVVMAVVVVMMRVLMRYFVASIMSMVGVPTPRVSMLESRRHEPPCQHQG